MTKPSNHSSTWFPAHSAMPDLGARHAHYDPPCWSIVLSGVDGANDIYVTGTPADLHAFALRVIAVADQAAAAEAKLAGRPTLHGRTLEPAPDEEFVGL